MVSPPPAIIFDDFAEVFRRIEADPQEGHFARQRVTGDLGQYPPGVIHPRADSDQDDRIALEPSRLLIPTGARNSIQQLGEMLAVPLEGIGTDSG
jgi:hypothetical protein